MSFRFHQTNKNIDMNKALHDSINHYDANNNNKKSMTSNTIINMQSETKQTKNNGHKIKQSCITESMDYL
jgi:hypothetical protein